jgi:hypothetical protein
MDSQVEPSEFQPWTKTTGSGTAAADRLSAAEAGTGRRDTDARRSAHTLRVRFLITPVV